MGTGSNAGRGQEAGRTQAGKAQAQVRWNRLCSLTASLKLKAPHTHRAFVLHPMGSNTSQNSHPTQPKNPKTHSKTQQQGPGWGLEITKKQNCSPASGEALFQTEKALLTPKIRFSGFVFVPRHIPTAFGLRETPEQGTHPVAPKEAPHAQMVGWVSFFIKSLLLFSGNSQDQPRTQNSNCRTSQICSLRGEAFLSLLQSLEPKVYLFGGSCQACQKNRAVLWE